MSAYSSSFQSVARAAEGEAQEDLSNSLVSWLIASIPIVLFLLLLYLLARPYVRLMKQQIVTNERQLLHMQRMEETADRIAFALEKSCPASDREQQKQSEVKST